RAPSRRPEAARRIDAPADARRTARDRTSRGTVREVLRLADRVATSRLVTSRLVTSPVRLAQRVPVRLRRRADLQVDPVRRRRVTALVRRVVDFAAAARVRARVEAALLELALHRIRVKRRDAERDVTDARGAGRAAAATTAAPDDHVADVADLHLVLA